MTALIAVKLGLCGLPSGIPDRIAILDIEVFTIGIKRAVVIAITGETQELGILIEGVTSACVGDQRKELIGSEVVDPGSRSFGSSDNVLFVRIIKKTELHRHFSFYMY